jgi:hypothetical protein
MGALAWTILVGRVWGGRFNMITGVGEKRDNIVTTTEFATKIEANVAIWSCDGEAVES